MSEEEEEYSFEYSEEEDDIDMQDDEMNLLMQIENQYYSAKQYIEENPINQNIAITHLSRVLEMQDEHTDWGFKALKRMVKLLFQLQQYDEAIQRYEELLGYTKSDVTRNVGEKGINSILDFVSTSKDWDILQRFYEKTLETLKEDRNERLWFKTNLKLGKLLYEINDFSRLNKIIKELLNSTQEDDGGDNVKKNSQLLEVYALQIQMYTSQKDNKKLASIYEKALCIKSGVIHPRTVGVIRECGGKMYMMQRDWASARADFFESFKNYDEAGEPRRLQCLKYLILANMLSGSQVNVFDSQEAKPYEHDKEIVAMTDLMDAVLHDEIKTLERVLMQHKASIMSDPFIKDNIDNLLRTTREKVLLKIVRPYKRMDIHYIAKELNGISVSEVEMLLSSLVLDQKIDAKIDQVNHILFLGSSQPKQQRNVELQGAIANWCMQLDKLQHTMMNNFATANGGVGG